MKINIHWDRVFGLCLAILVVLIAIFCFKYIDRSDQSAQQEIGQCDMQDAQKIIDNLVRIYLIGSHKFS